jgi:hypothetical protein
MKHQNYKIINKLAYLPSLVNQIFKILVLTFMLNYFIII